MAGALASVSIVFATAVVAAPVPRGVVETAPPMLSGLYLTIFGGAALPGSVDGYTPDAPAPCCDTPSSDPDVFSFPTGAGFSIGEAIGAHIAQDLRGEVEMSYASRASTGGMNFRADPSLIVSGGFSTAYALANLWYDFDPGNGLTPYLGGGIGGAILLPNITNVSGGNENLQYITPSAAPAAQLGAGIKVQLPGQLALDAGYRVKAVYNPVLKSTDNASYRLQGNAYIDQTMQAGLSFGF